MKHWFKTNRGIIIFLLCFGIFRTAIADWNPIPSGSMRPTLLEGDVVLVNRLAYDIKIPITDISIARIADPRRGDVVTFTSPKNGTRLIKRIVAVPGDVVEMKHDVLYLNGTPAEYSDHLVVQETKKDGTDVRAIRVTEHVAESNRTVQFLPAVSAMRTFGPLVVPADNYFALGDNRDNSEDSRYIGFIPRKLLIGHAHRVLVSADIKGNWLPRFSRTAWAIQ